MSTTFVIQGTYMKLKFSSFSVPSASLSLFDIIAVLAIIPVMDYIVYPLLQRCGISFTPLRRIGVGFLMAAAAMMVAGFVEIKRRGRWEQGHVFNQLVNGEKYGGVGSQYFLADSTVFLHRNQRGSCQYHR